MKNGFTCVRLSLVVVGWVGLLFFMSCRFADLSDVVREFMPGVYERVVDDSMGNGKIVLVVSHRSGDGYTVERRSVLSRIRRGVELPVERDTTLWSAVYDAKHRILQEQRKGKVLLFVPEENRLLIGGTAYLKIK